MNITAEENRNKVVRECIEALKAAGFVDVGFLNRLIVQKNPNINTKSFLAYCEGQNKSLAKTVMNLRDYEFEGLMDTIESYAESLAKERAVEFSDWIKTFDSLEKGNGQWFIESQIESEKLYDTFLAEKRKEGEPKFIHEEIKNSKVVIQRKEGAE